MAQAVVKYTFAVLLALLSSQAVMPPARNTAPVEFVCLPAAAQQISQQLPRLPLAVQAQQPSLTYSSTTRPAPDLVALLQRPPPSFSL